MASATPGGPLGALGVKLSDLPTPTRDGTNVKLNANVCTGFRNRPLTLFGEDDVHAPWNAYSEINQRLHVYGLGPDVCNIDA